MTEWNKDLSSLAVCCILVWIQDQAWAAVRIKGCLFNLACMAFGCTSKETLVDLLFGHIQTWIVAVESLITSWFRAYFGRWSIRPYMSMDHRSILQWPPQIGHAHPFGRRTAAARCLHLDVAFGVAVHLIISLRSSSFGFPDSRLKGDFWRGRF